VHIGPLVEQQRQVAVALHPLQQQTAAYGSMRQQAAGSVSGTTIAAAAAAALNHYRGYLSKHVVDDGLIGWPSPGKLPGSSA
jgi:hypothetical protein